jgi:Xaa-Pro aminopeptidase
MQELINRLRGAHAAAGLERAVLSHPETLAQLCLFDPAVEEWPVANPFVASPALLVLQPDDATLLVASFHAGHAARSPVPVEQYRSYDHEAPPAPAAELAGRLRELARGVRRIGVEASSLPVGVADVLREDGSELQSVDELVVVLCDTSPWIDGHWSDSANAVVPGSPSAEQRRIFDRVRRALALALELCRPGALACEVDRAVRAELEDLGPTYPHHTGHAIGASWSEPPGITPYERIRLEEGMVLAVEPAFYAAGFGGIRLEHVFVVRQGGNQLLTRFEHTL